MSDYQRTKLVAFSAIAALAGLLIVIISAHTLFSELLFYSIVIILIGIIVVLVAYAFLWDRTTRYVSTKLRKRRMNRLAREYFDDFRGFVDRFTSLPEFRGAPQGILGMLESLLKKDTKGYGILIDIRAKNFISILQNPLLNDFKQRLDNLHWKKKEINHEFLSSLVKEFEYYVMLHKWLYVDFAVTTAREIGLDTITQPTKRAYSDYKDDYNQFIIAYTEFARRSSKAKLRIFNERLRKAYEL